MLRKTDLLAALALGFLALGAATTPSPLVKQWREARAPALVRARDAVQPGSARRASTRNKACSLRRPVCTAPER